MYLVYQVNISHGANTGDRVESFINSFQNAHIQSLFFTIVNKDIKDVGEFKKRIEYKLKFIVYFGLFRNFDYVKENHNKLFKSIDRFYEIVKNTTYIQYYKFETNTINLITKKELKLNSKIIKEEEKYISYFQDEKYKTKYKNHLKFMIIMI